MTTAVARIEDTLTADKVALLKRTICPNFTDDEMELFAAVARRSGLDPFARQIYATKRKDKKSGTEKLTIQTGIDGFRVIAARTGELDGQEGPYWCGADGVWKDVWLSDKPPAAAKVIVYRKGIARGFVGVARFSEYAQAWPDGNLSGLWPKMGATMIAKCAEALALRKAFPQDLSGLYTSDEMEQADEPDVPPKPATTTAPHQQLPAAKASGPAPQAESTPDDRVKRGEKMGSPLNDSRAIKDLAARKGFTMVQVFEGINAKFKATYTPLTTPWGDVAKSHREETIKALEKLPDLNSVGDLEALIKRTATATGEKPEYLFQRYCTAAELHECITAPEHMTVDQVKTACNSFRKKLDSLADVAGEGNGE